MINLEAFHALLDDARHAIGHAMSMAAQGYTIGSERELSRASTALEAARRMFDDKEVPNAQA